MLFRVFNHLDVACDLGNHGSAGWRGVGRLAPRPAGTCPGGLPRPGRKCGEVLPAANARPAAVSADEHASLAPPAGTGQRPARAGAPGRHAGSAPSRMFR